MDAGDGLGGGQPVATADSGNEFEWDESSQLYFHPRSGLYHDAASGWYYNTGDGMYYALVDGEFVLWDSVKNVSHEVGQSSDMQCSSDHDTNGYCRSDDNAVAELVSPPSQWLEETLINLYLTGYPESVACQDDTNSALKNEGVDMAWDEEIWRGQYGQVAASVNSGSHASSIKDLWDWYMEEHTVDKIKTATLVGRVVKKSLKLHPSISSGNKILRTSCIRETHLDLVRVETGHVYRLKNPSARYTASVTVYDSSNPTKDWGFPDLELQSFFCHSSDQSSMGSNNFLNVEVFPSKKEKKDDPVFRDRAAERRALHGGFGIGPGQKNLSFDYTDGQSEEYCHDFIIFDDNDDHDCNTSLEIDGYGKRVLQNMGWQEGEGLGKHNQGLLEPLQPVGNKGNAGLGWSQIRRDPYRYTF